MQCSCFTHDKNPKGLTAKQTSRSWCCISWARQGRHCFTTSKGGEGFLFLNKCRTWDGTEKQILIDKYIRDLVHGYLHRFEIVQVTFLRKGAGVSDFTRASRGCNYKKELQLEGRFGPLLWRGKKTIIRSLLSDPYLDDTIVDNMIPHYRTVSCDVAKRPHGLRIIFVMGELMRDVKRESMPFISETCSQTLWSGLLSSFTKNGTAPALTTALVWSEVPLAMLVRAQADSNWSMALSVWPRNSTSLNLVEVILAWHSWLIGEWRQPG